ncbi:MAG: hypothetical protein MZW92_29730 [Comamonadaceae bacterium]|nr:hypothetical protein [Comamonadaceae bacterium]
MAKKRRERNDALLDEFNRNRMTILVNIGSEAHAGDFAGAAGDANKYARVTQDPDLVAPARSIKVEQARADLGRENELSLERRAELYAVLAESEPGNYKYVDEAKRLALEVESAKRAAEEARKRQEKMARRSADIQRQFSGWDGSHPAVEQAIKASLHNPASYEHVETRYSDTGDSLVVVTKFRATNGFGAIVTNTAVGTVDDRGEVVFRRWSGNFERPRGRSQLRASWLQRRTFARMRRGVAVRASDRAAR